MIYSLLSILFNPPQADCALSSHESPREFAKRFGSQSGRSQTIQDIETEALALPAQLYDSGI